MAADLSREHEGVMKAQPSGWFVSVDGAAHWYEDHTKNPPAHDTGSPTSGGVPAGEPWRAVTGGEKTAPLCEKCREHLREGVGLPVEVKQEFKDMPVDPGTLANAFVSELDDAAKERRANFLRSRFMKITDPPSDFERVGMELGMLVSEKNAAYGDSFARSGECLKLIFPDGVRPEQYRDLLGVARVLDKLFRIGSRKDAFGESPWRDVGGYGIVASVAEEREKRDRGKILEQSPEE